MSLKHHLLSGFPNQVEECSIAVMGHYPEAVRLAVRNAAGIEKTETLHLGDAVPLLQGWTVSHIELPLPTVGIEEREVPGRGSGRAVVTISKG